MTVATFVRQTPNPLERLYDALVDPARCERAMALLLTGYCAAWTLYGVIAKGSQDLNFDMGEMYAWSREVTFGTPKHPPLGAWLVRLWFGVFPTEVWAFYLLSIVLATAALWIAWRVAGRYLPPDKRAAGVMWLSLLPFYNFFALKFNANSVETPFWALTTWAFLWSLDTRRPGWAVLAGIGAAAAILGKYWAIFLLAGLVVAALSDPRRRAYFRSPAPWLTIVAGAAVLAPHVVWLLDHNFGPFGYALTEHAVPPEMALESAAGFLIGILGYIGTPILCSVIAARPNAAAIRDTLWPADPDRRTVVVAFAAPLLLAVLASIALREEIVSLWAMPAMTLLPVVLTSSRRVKFPRLASLWLLGISVAFPLIMVALSPAVAIVVHNMGVAHYGTQYRKIARAVESVWAQRTNAPLRVVGSYTNVVNGIIFYLRSEPSTLDIVAPDQTPWSTDERIAREGAAIVCPVPEKYCLTRMNAYTARFPGAETTDVTLVREYIGIMGRPVQYRIMVIPPQP